MGCLSSADAAGIDQGAGQRHRRHQLSDRVPVRGSSLYREGEAAATSVHEPKDTGRHVPVPAYDEGQNRPGIHDHGIRTRCLVPGLITLEESVSGTRTGSPLKCPQLATRGRKSLGPEALWSPLASDCPPSSVLTIIGPALREYPQGGAVPMCTVAERLSLGSKRAREDQVGWKLARLACSLPFTPSDP